MGTCAVCSKSEQERHREGEIISQTKKQLLSLKYKPETTDSIQPFITTVPKSPSMTSETEDDESSGHSKSTTHSTEELEMSPPPKTAISAAYLISKIFHDYFLSMEQRCEFMTLQENESMVESILQNLYIHGASTRQILLKEHIGDLYFLCNTAELNQIHLQHLQKYHGQKSHQDRNLNCGLWQIYLHKFEEKCKSYDKKMFEILEYSEDYKSKEDLQASPKYIHDCDYILNAKYLVHILCSNAPMFENKLSCKIIHRPSAVLFALQIIDEFRYNELDLDGQGFHFMDIPPMNTNLEISIHEQRQIELYHQKTRMELAEDVQAKTNMAHFRRSSLHSNRDSSNMLRDVDLSRSLKDIVNTTKEVDISIAICKISMEEYFHNRIDFSINGTVLSLLAVKQIMDDSDSFMEDKDIYDELVSKLECKGNEFDVMKDVDSQLLTSTFEAVSKDDNVHRHFWRAIKFSIQYFDEGWRINPRLIHWYKELYGEWIANDEWLKSYKNQRIQITQQFNYGYAKTLGEYEKMMKVFDSLGYHEKLQNALKTNNDFKKKWVDALLQNDEKIVNMFKRYGYPIYAVSINRN